jgi:F-type H+-transporting ATPase subunit c
VAAKRRVFAWFVLVLVATFAVPVMAQGEAGAQTTPASSLPIAIASIITAGFALGIAAGLGAIGQGKAIGSAAEAIARNPSAVADIRGVLILGLVLIESLVIYVLFISLLLFFAPPFK